MRFCGFGKTRGCVNNVKMFFWGWTIPLIAQSISFMSPAGLGVGVVWWPEHFSAHNSTSLLGPVCICPRKHALALGGETKQERTPLKKENRPRMSDLHYTAYCTLHTISFPACRWLLSYICKQFLACCTVVYRMFWKKGECIVQFGLLYNATFGKCIGSHTVQSMHIAKIVDTFKATT